MVRKKRRVCGHAQAKRGESYVVGTDTITPFECRRCGWRWLEVT